MKHIAMTILTLVAIAPIGCKNMSMGRAPKRGAVRNLGAVSQPQAMAAAEKVLAQYFHVASVDADSGILRSHPRPVDAKRERLLGSSPARQLATVYLFAEGDAISAQVLVIQQRQGSVERRTMSWSGDQNPDAYSGNPGDLSPAQRDAATTAEQNENWQDERRLQDIEQKILNDIVQALPGR